MLLTRQDQKLIAAIHAVQRSRDRGGPLARLLSVPARLRYMFWTVISASDIHRDARIDASARFPHLTGVVIHRDAVVGRDCLIMQQVTLGQGAENGAPVLEEGVYIGTGAKVLGAITIGAGARIGANAVVLEDVPPGTTAVGVPAVIKTR